MKITRLDLIKNAKLLMSKDNDYKLPDISSSISSVGLTETIINAFFVTQIIHFQIELAKINFNLPKTLNFVKEEAEAFKEISEANFTDKNIDRVLKKIRKHLTKEFKKYQPSINSPARQQLLNLVKYLIDKDLILHKNSPAFIFVEKIDLDPIFAIFSSYLIELELAFRAQNQIDVNKDDFGKLLQAIQDPSNYDNNQLHFSGMIKKVPEWSTLMSSAPDKIKIFVGRHSDIVFSGPTRNVLFSTNTQAMRDAKEQFLQSTQRNAETLFNGLMSDFNLQEENLLEPSENQSLSQIKNPAVLMYMLKEGIDLLNQCLQQNDSVIERLSEVKPLISHDELSSHLKSLYAALTSIETLKLAIHKEQLKVQRRNTVTEGSELKLMDFQNPKDHHSNRHSAITTSTNRTQKTIPLVRDPKTTGKYTPRELPKTQETNKNLDSLTSNYLTDPSQTTTEADFSLKVTPTSRPADSGGFFSNLSFRSLIPSFSKKEPTVLGQDQSNATVSSSSSSLSSTLINRKAPDKTQVIETPIEETEPEAIINSNNNKRRSSATGSNSSTPPRIEALFENDEDDGFPEIEQQDGAPTVNLNSSRNNHITGPNLFSSPTDGGLQINKVFEDPSEDAVDENTLSLYPLYSSQSTGREIKNSLKPTGDLYSNGQADTNENDSLSPLREAKSNKKKLEETKKESTSNTNPSPSGTDKSKNPKVKSLTEMFATKIASATPPSTSQNKSSTSSTNINLSFSSSELKLSSTSSSISSSIPEPDSISSSSSHDPSSIPNFSYNTSSIFSSSSSTSLDSNSNNSILTPNISISSTQSPSHSDNEKDLESRRALLAQKQQDLVKRKEQIAKNLQQTTLGVGETIQNLP